MKKIFYTLLMAASLAALSGCNKDDDGNKTETETGIVLSGNLSPATSVLNGPVFRATGKNNPSPVTNAANDGQTFRATIDEDNKITGKLQDGSITFELSGNYDPTTGVFSMQAPSSTIIFSIVGRLNASEQIIAGETSASVKVKSDGEWTSTPLNIVVADVTVDGSVNADQTSVTKIPATLRGNFTDQIMALAETSLGFTVTENSITMYDGDDAPQDLTVLEVTNADGSIATAAGPWSFLVSATYWYGNSEFKTEYIGRFYVAKTFDNTLQTAIGGSPAGDLYFSDGNEIAGEIAQALATPAMQNATAYVTPYCAEEGVTTTGIYPVGTFSPMFTEATATADAKAATVLKAISGFTLVLK